MKKYFLLTLMVLIFVPSRAQNITTEVNNYAESKSTIISKGRNYILDLLVTDQIDKMRDVYLYLNDSIADADYAPFTPFEQINLACWTRDYDYALKEILYLDSINQLKANKYSQPKPARIYPENDILATKIYEKTFPVLVSVHNNIDASSLQVDKKEALKILLTDMYTARDNLFSEKQKNVNNMVADFLRDYPESLYAHYLQHNVRYEFKRTGMGVGYDFGVGYSHPMKPMNSFYKDGFAVSFGFEFWYKEAVAYLRAMLSPSKTKTDIVGRSNITIPKETSMSLSNAELSLGYNVLNNNHLTITPFAGIGMLSSTFNEKTLNQYPMLEDVETTSFSTQFGLNFDIFFKKKELSQTFPLRLRFTYVNPRHVKYPTFEGGFFNVTLGIAFQSWGITRGL